MKEMKEPISLDTSLQIVGSLKIDVIKQIRAEQAGENNPEKIKDLEQTFDMYCTEENLLYSGDPFKQLSVMDKVVRLYAPIIKKTNSGSQPNKTE